MKQPPDLTLEQLQEENARLLAVIEKQEGIIQNLHHQLHLFQNTCFGRKTEKGVVPKQEAMAFDEAEPPSEEENEDVDVKQEDVITETAEEKKSTKTKPKKKTGRKTLPKSLPYVEKIHDLTKEEKQCPCGCEMAHIGNDISEQLDVVPQMTFRVVHIRKKYACKRCEETIQTAKLPKQPIPKSIAAPGLLAAVVDAKFNRHMPLYRQEAMFKEADISVTRATLCNWVIKTADLLLPLVTLMTSTIQEYDIAYADETPLQVLKQKNKSPTSKSYMWLFIGGPPDKRSFVYQYHPTRSHQVPATFFEAFNGYLHADCYSGYVALGKLPHITHVACLAHARRYFVDIAKLAKKKKGIAHQVLAYIAELYHIEAALKEKKATPQTIYQTRKQKSQPIFEKMKAFVEEKKPKIPPKSPLGKAVKYLLTHWASLTHYLHDGRLEIDNNQTERSIKPFVIGRKNWLFHGNDIGAKAGATLYSLIETCKHHKIDAFAWLKYALTNIPYVQTVQQLDVIGNSKVD